MILPPISDQGCIHPVIKGQKFEIDCATLTDDVYRKALEIGVRELVNRKRLSLSDLNAREMNVTRRS